ncbi:MAG: DUF885 domain-containing protein [Acidobacteriota bacterium]
MQRKQKLDSLFSAAFALCILSSVVLGCAASQDSESGTADDRLVAFLDQIFEERVALAPERESRLGRKTEQQSQWNDRSDAFAAERIERARSDLDRLRADHSRDELSPQGQLSWDLFVFDTERAIANHAFRDHHYVVDQFNGQLSSLLTLLKNHHDVDSVADAEAYVQRIEGLEDVLKLMARQLAERAGFGVVAPAFAFPDVIADATSMSSGAPLGEGPVNPLWADFRAKVAELPDGEQGRLTEAARAALQGPFRRGFEALLEELRRVQPLAIEQGNRGVWALPRGESFYANRVAHHTTLSLDASQIHEIGVAEVARIHEQMRALQQQVGVPGSLQDFFDFVREDPGNAYEDSDAGREQFLVEARRLVDGIYGVVGEWFNRLPEAEMEVRRVEPWRENSVSIAFYSRPSQDGSKPGIYYANLGDMQSVQRYVFTAITYHESVPGHHFQIALAQELEGLPLFRRFGGYGAYAEGWALYAEQLAGEMGFYQEPLHEFGRLQNELWRAARLVIDTGIHAKRWTREQAIRYFQENTPLSEGNVVTEVERFFVNPGQALSYKMGMIKILELRERARQELGGSFDIRSFHDVVIGAGSMPLPLLEGRVDAWIAESAAASPPQDRADA